MFSSTPGQRDIMIWHKPQNSILAYKGITGVAGLEEHNIGSRTNLNGNIQVIPREEERKFNFESFRDSCEHISKRCEQLGYDAVTFQNHTRIGHKKHIAECEREISEILASG